MKKEEDKMICDTALIDDMLDGCETSQKRSDEINYPDNTFSPRLIQRTKENAEIIDRYIKEEGSHPYYCNNLRSYIDRKLEFAEAKVSASIGGVLLGGFLTALGAFGKSDVPYAKSFIIGTGIVTTITSLLGFYKSKKNLNKLLEWDDILN